MGAYSRHTRCASAEHCHRDGRVGSAGASGSAPFFRGEAQLADLEPTARPRRGTGNRGSGSLTVGVTSLAPTARADAGEPRLLAHGSTTFNLDSAHQRDAAHWPIAGRCPLARIRIQPHLSLPTLPHTHTLPVGAEWMSGRMGPTFVLRVCVCVTATNNGHGLRGPARCAENVSTMTYSR